GDVEDAAAAADAEQAAAGEPDAAKHRVRAAEEGVGAAIENVEAPGAGTAIVETECAALAGDKVGVVEGELEICRDGASGLDEGAVVAERGDGAADVDGAEVALNVEGGAVLVEPNRAKADAD